MKIKLLTIGVRRFSLTLSSIVWTVSGTDVSLSASGC